MLKMEQNHIPGTSILGAQIAPEISQEGTSKARFNQEQLDRREAEKGKSVAAWKAAVKEDKLRCRLQAAAVIERRLQVAEEMALRVAKEAERLEEEEEEAKRRRWDKEVTQVIQARWHRVGSRNGEARVWQTQVIKKAKAC